MKVVITAQGPDLTNDVDPRFGRAAWLQKIGLDRPAPVPAESLAQAQSAGPNRSPTAVLTDAGIVTPLTLSRRWLITRGELAGLRLDFDGTPLLSGLGRPLAPEATP